jgi:hypothetical protein
METETRIESNILMVTEEVIMVGLGRVIYQYGESLSPRDLELDGQNGELGVCWPEPNFSALAGHKRRVTAGKTGIGKSLAAATDNKYSVPKNLIFELQE